MANPTGIGFVDSFAVQVETVRIDTPSTKNQSHIIVGKYVDENLGVIQASTFTQLSYAGFDTLSIDRIDSVKLTFKYDFFLGDTTGKKKISLDILRITDNIDSTVKYNATSSLSTDPLPLESVSFGYDMSTYSFSKTITSSSLITALNDVKGKTEAQFKENFKGIQLVPTSTSFAIGLRAGSTSGISFTIYGHKPSNPDSVSTPFLLNISDKSQRFVSATYDVAKFPQGIVAQSSSNSNNKGIMNDLLGIRTRISFPGLTNFLKSIKDDYNLMEAYIVFPSAQNFTQNNDSPFPYMYLYECSSNGNVSKDASGNFSVVQSEKSSSYGTGDLYGTSNPYFLTYDNSNARFKYPFSLYAKEIQKGGKANNPFIVSIGSYYSTYTQTTFTYPFFDRTSGGIKLVAYYNKRTL